MKFDLKFKTLVYFYFTLNEKNQFYESSDLIYQPIQKPNKKLNSS